MHLAINIFTQKIISMKIYAKKQHIKKVCDSIDYNEEDMFISTNKTQ